MNRYSPREKEDGLGKRPDSSAPPTGRDNTESTSSAIKLPTINLPKGGGAIRGIEEKFQVNSVTGTASLGIPIPFSPSRGGFVPPVGFGYNSGNGNSPFGLGWDLGIPSIVRKTENLLPQYKDEEESDTFVLSGVEDLIPFLEKDGNAWKPYKRTRIEEGISYTVRRYLPRIEGSFSITEKWKNNATGETHWRTISGDNVHSYYGVTSESRISDPSDSSRVFEWKLCRVHDDKGDICIYEYKKEDLAGISNKQNEKNRKVTQSYIKKIFYGNKQPFYLGDALPVENDFLFKAVFDYGEHDPSPNIPKDVDVQKTVWTSRKDPFSSYRSGFEIRTYRRCSRVLVFHCFDQPELPHTPYLVKSLQLFFDDDLDLIGSGEKISGFSYLTKVRQSGHRWNSDTNSYSTKSLPEIELTYQQHAWDSTIRQVSEDNAAGAPIGIKDRQYVWVDLFSEGIAGILAEQAGAWFYKSNLGNGNFSQPFAVSPKPGLAGLSTEKVVVLDLEGDGSKYLVEHSTQPKGFFKLTDDDEWQSFKPFEAFPNFDINVPNIRVLDVTGDGRADLVFTEENRITWWRSRGEQGFEVPQSVAKEIDEEKGAAIIFADRTQSIFIADMNGDGLSDIVRIRNGEICYWANLGYGRFGAKVNMDNAPRFDHSDAFNPKYLRLADIDGSGTIDVIYLGKNDFRVWMNLNGNEWSNPQVIAPFPEINDLSDVTVIDVLGTGTASIVNSSSLPQRNRQPLRYIDLMGSKKPHLLIKYENNCGKEATIEYKASTHFYLEDKNQGRKWITKLPFPVHCISKVRSEDKIRKTVFTCSYRYSHGYFDHEEKEFRGFARVEQLDTEEFDQFRLNEAKNVVDEIFHQPPVRTVSWFHTGAFLRKEKVLHQCRSEYFKNTEFDEYDIPEPIIADDLSINELREAWRALKGLPLRTETYADDESPLRKNPYAAGHSNVEIRRIQRKENNRNASFLIVPSETIGYAYDRDPSDPRVSHTFVLETDELGNTRRSASVVYPRAKRPTPPNEIPDKVWNEQNKLHVVYGESFYTNDIIDDSKSIYRLRVGFESKSYEIAGFAPPVNFFFSKQQIKTGIDSAAEVLFEEEFTGGFQKRLSTQSRAYFLNDDLTAPLSLGQLSSLGIGHKVYNLAFTKNLITKLYGSKVTDLMLADAKYVHSEGDDHWWTQSGTVNFSASPKSNFFTPIGGRDVFGNERLVEYDAFTLLIKSATDALGNKITAASDYRTLAPVLVTDPNLNRQAVETDELGMVIKTAVMGKSGAGEGDTLNDPTSRMEYDLFNWQNHRKPNHVHTFVREQHGPANPRWQETYVYSDGGGSVIMSKVQTKPGTARGFNPVTGQVDEVNANPRWIGNGRTIVNNKGKPVKQYEPYFSTTHEYESEDALVETGVSAINFYDALGRNIRVEYPNGTFSRIEFDSWKSKVFDVNDTVKDSRWYTVRGSPDPTAIPEPGDPEQRAAWLAAKHHNTPGILHTDSLGRTILAISDYGDGKTASVYSESDLLGRYARLFDQLGRNVSEAYTNLLGTPIYGKTAEKGERWTFNDAMGRVDRIWDNEIREFHSSFDALHRPTSTFVKEGDNEILFGHVVYGEIFADAAQRNLKGRAYRFYDQAGAITFKKLDFKGNIVEVERRLSKSYDQALNWKDLVNGNTVAAIDAAAEPLLEAEVFSSSTSVDALNRPMLLTLPDASVVEPKYNEGNLLDSLRVKIRGTGDFITFLQNQDYDAKGQRQFAQYGNGLITKYSYDPLTFHLNNLLTRKAGDRDAQSLQNISYTFDPRGHIVYETDEAQQTNYFANAVVKADNKFEYDAIYQLVKATGREHAGLGGNSQRDHQDLPYLAQLPHQNDLNAVRKYTEIYQYDDCGNIMALQHLATGGNWTQRYRYQYQDDTTDKTNRLKSTSLPGDPDAGPYSATYEHGLHDNMTRMPHLEELVWNFMDQLTKVNLGGGGFAFYTYGIGSRRARKVVQRQGGKRIERIYLGPVEIYREYQNGTRKFQRGTLLIADNAGRIAQIDTKVFDENNVDPANALNSNLIRYQYTNHLGSATMETDQFGTVISYEEYHPYGTSSYRSSKSDVDLSLKRYRFSGKERDDETGLYHFGARYYAPWLARWTSTDPAGFAGGPNLFRYCGNNPVVYTDPSGLDRVYQLGAQYNRDIHTNTAAARGRLEQALTGREVTEGGVTYRINRPALEWRGDRTGWYFNTRQSDISRVGSEITFEAEVVEASPPAATPGQTTESPPAAPPASQTVPPAGSSTAGGGSGGESAEHERHFFTSSFFKGLVIGLAVTLAVVAIVATGGAALAVIAPAAAEALAASATVAAVGTGLQVAGVGLLAANTVQSVRQRDLLNNPISEDQANFNLGFGLGAAAGGTVAKPVAGAAVRAAGLGPAAGAEEVALLAGRRASTVEVLEGAGVNVGEYAPAGQVLPQSTGYTCVAASCRMLASDIGVALSEEQVAAALGTEIPVGGVGGGAFLGDAPAALESLGIPGGQFAGRTAAGGAPATLAELQAALATGRSAAVGLRVPSGIGPHALVVDSIVDGTVFIRDPLRVGIGSSFSMPVGELGTLGFRSFFFIPPP